MSFKRFRRSQPGQAVHVPGVSHPRVFIDGGEPYSALPSPGGAPRPSVHRLFDLDRIGSGSFTDFSPGYGGRLESPMQVLRRVLRSPVASAVVRVGRPPVRSVASQRRSALSWRAFNALQDNPRSRVCVRRLQRKQVLFAKKVAGRRGGSPGPYRRNLYSQWGC